MTASRSVTKGKIVLVPFPFDDLRSEKVRPAVCLTEPIGPYRHVVLAFLTSRTPPDPLDSDVLLDATGSEFETTGLHVSSVVRLHRLMTVSTSIIQRELGVLPPQAQAEVDEKLRVLFQLMS